MGAGASATQMVFFITSVIIALSVVGAIFLNIQSISSAAIVGSKTFAEQLKTDITIIGDPELIPYNSSSGIYTFYVKNTGKEELDIQYITVIIDGTIVIDSNLNKTNLGSDPMWLSGDVLRINATTSLQDGSHNLRVITANGIEDTFSFRTP
ncbi:MAG: flagellar protein G [Candidatus Methanoperedens sp.]|nr:flagellar protein G [Candidatus Methanoperedens sp.]